MSNHELVYSFGDNNKVQQLKEFLTENGFITKDDGTIIEIFFDNGVQGWLIRDLYDETSIR